jgi:hypothetical protein
MKEIILRQQKKEKNSFEWRRRRAKNKKSFVLVRFWKIVFNNKNKVKLVN